MAIQYSPQGRRVGLGGPNSVGFNPVQAVDTSRAYLEAGNQAIDSFARAREIELANREKDLESLVGLSETVTKYFLERQKGINENDRKLGIADILNGDLQPKPEALLEYQSNTKVLKDAATGEQQALNQLEPVNRAAALEIRANDPVISSWRQYGRAQGIAMKAGSSAEFMLTQAMESTVENVPITQPDGTTRMIAPGRAKTPAELNAAWAVVLQGFIGASGLDGINPLLLAEKVAPTIMEVRAKVFDRALNRIAKGQREESIENTRGLLGAAVSATDLNDPAELSGLFQDGVRELMLADPEMPRAKANELVYESLLAQAELVGDPNAAYRIGMIPISADGNMSLGTLSTRFPGMARRVADGIVSRNEAEAERKRKEQQAIVENVIKAYERELLDAPTPDAAEGIRTKAEALLKQMEADGLPGASAALVDLSSRPRRMSGKAYQDAIIAKSIAQPGSITREQIVKAIADGELPMGFDKRMTFPADAVEPRAKQYDALADNAAKGFITAQMSGAAWKPTDLESSEVVTRQFQLGREIKAAIRKGVAQDPNFSSENAAKIVEDTLKKAERDRRFLLKPTRSNKPGFPVEFQAPLKPNTVRVDTGAKGQSTLQDFSTVPPIDLSGFTVRPKDTLLSPNALAEADKVYRTTGSYPGAVKPLVVASGLTQAEFSRAQSGQPRGLASRAQNYQMAVLDNPRSTTIEQLTARYQIDRQKLIMQGQDIPMGGLSPETAELLNDLGKHEGGPMAYEAANKGGAGDLPGGRPGLTNMTIDQVLAQKDLHHAGKYQLQLGKGRTLDNLKQRLGLSGSEKFTPELQDRMAAELIWGGWKRPALTAYLKGGGSEAAAVEDFNNEWEIGKLGYDVRPHLRRMRAAYTVRGAGAVGQTANFSKNNVASVNWESPTRGDSYQKGGVDLYFKDNQFPAVAPGKVADIGNQPGGYGLYVITEHRDPKTGLPFQLINAHLDAIHVKLGQTIQPGTILGRQGSTGNAPAGAHSSIDPLEPAPRGSKQTIPYRRPEVLRELLAPLGIR
jgi:murein DD-endopeptidase MepM/ murein hydrolase activator NlpD